MRWKRAEWSTDEITLLVTLWGTTPAWKIGEQLNRPIESIRNKARRLHLPPVSYAVGQGFRRPTRPLQPMTDAEKRIGADDESQRWCNYWLARRQARIARCGGQVWSAC